MRIINIQSISDLITNSSTEVFVVYSKSNINSIKELVNSILSLLDSSKTFDDYFTIEMEVNYDDLLSIFNRYYTYRQLYNEIPEFEIYSKLDYEEANKFVQSLPLERIEVIFDWAKSHNWDRHYQLYEGFIVSAKDENDPVIRKVATVLNNIDNIFDADYLDDY